LQVGKGPNSEMLLRSIDFDTGWNLSRLSDLQSVVRRLVGKGPATTADLAGARREIAAIRSRGPAFPAAAVAARVGGGWIEVLAGIVVGLVAGAVHFGATRSRQLDLLQSFAGALCG